MAMTHPITIAGCGPGAAEFVTPAAREAAKSATVLVGARRLMELFPAATAERIACEGVIEPLLDRLAELRDGGAGVVVLVSGDPGVFSLTQKVVQRFGRANCRIIPGVSSVQVAFARIGLDWADARIISAHARTPAATAEELARHDRIAVLAGTREAMEWIGRTALKLGLDYAAFVCENLTLPDERVSEVRAAELAAWPAASRTVVLLVREESLR